MAFVEVQLPDDIAQGAIGGPGFNTTILSLTSGFEKRNANWSASRGRWDIGYGITTKAQFEKVIAFFYTRLGQANGFRFKDWSDFEIGQGTSGNLGVGDGVITAFQARKQYISGSVIFNRIINKLVTGTIKVFLDDIETLLFSVDITTGLITLDSAPAGGVVVSLTSEFDVPVRFNTDTLELSLKHFDAGTIVSIPVIELRI